MLHPVPPVKEFPAGTTADCPTCGRKLYRLTRSVQLGAPMVAMALERVEAVHEPVQGVVIECPEHGAVEHGHLVWTLPHVRLSA